MSFRSLAKSKPSSPIREFARQQNLRLRRCSDDDSLIIPGKRGAWSHIFEFSDTALAAIFTSPASKPPRTHHWRKYRGLCLAAGMTLTQNGDAESAFIFDHNDEDQLRLAIGLAEIRQRRRLSSESRAKAIVNLKKFRSNPRQGAPISDQERPEAVATFVSSLGP